MAGEKLVEFMQMAALGAMDDKGPSDLVLGQVTSINPLSVQVDNRLPLSEAFLIVPWHLTDYETQISFDNPGIKNEIEISGSKTAGTLKTDPDTPAEVTKPARLEGTISGQISYAERTRHDVTVYNALKVGDQVALLRAIGGERYYILDRVVVK